MLKALALCAWLSSLSRNVVAESPEFSDIYTFGDSLLDNGNFYAANPGVLPFPRTSNGPLLIEYIGAQLGIPINPALHLSEPEPVGNNFAMVAAYAIEEDLNEGRPPVLNLPTQVGAFLSSKGQSAPEDALYVMAIGSNDVLASGNFLERSFGTFGDDEKTKSGKKGGGRGIRKLSGKKKANASKEHDSSKKHDFLAVYLVLAENRIKMAVDSQIGELTKLAQAGAKNFLIIGVVDLSQVPQNRLIQEYFVKNAQTKEDKILGERMLQITQDLSLMYNTYLLEQVAQVLEPQFPDAKFSIFDAFSPFVELLDLGAFTFTKDPCLYVFQNPAYTSPARNPDCEVPQMEGFFFYDEIHPTTAVYMALSLGVLQFVMEQFS